MNRKINWIYFFVLLVFFLLVVWKQHAVLKERNQMVLSAVSEWEEKGKPVIVREIKKEKISVYIKITASKISDRVLEAYVSKDLRSQLKIGQDVIFETKKKKFKGSISMIDNEISIDEGMYKIQVSFEESIDFEGWAIVDVCINVLNDVICVPDEIVNKEREKSFVWKVDNGKAVRQDIFVGDRGGYGMVVTQGLNEGDLVIIEGVSILIEGDKVNILRTESKQETNND
ncbi:MAG: hypothetical protein PHY73_08675 [Candidatus Omnitrophica bacterium]|nr:hypothetical protein [Candidatus Omnitrophota bacterium]